MHLLYFILPDIEYKCDKGNANACAGITAEIRARADLINLHITSMLVKILLLPNCSDCSFLCIAKGSNYDLVGSLSKR